MVLVFYVVIFQFCFRLLFEWGKIQKLVFIKDTATLVAKSKSSSVFALIKTLFLQKQISRTTGADVLQC